MLCILNIGTVPTLCILNIGTVPTLCILYVGTVPTFRHSHNFFPHCTALGGLLGVVEGGVVVRMLSGMVVKVEVWVVVVWWLKKC